MDQPEASTRFAGRLKDAAVGLGLTIALLAIIAIVHLARIPYIVGAYKSLNPEQLAYVVSIERTGWLAIYAVAAALVVIYWLLTAAFGRGQLLRLRSANLILVLFALSVLAVSLYDLYYLDYGDLKGICPYLGISDVYPNPYGFDVESNCDKFDNMARSIFVAGLVGLPVVLLFVGVIVRIVSSRRAAWEEA